MRVDGIDFSKLTVESLLELLPETESDQWEWKSAILLDDGKSAELEAKLAKGLSSFANTGGGHFILGLKDGDKTPEPCRQSVGRQDIETWLHQKIASYVSPPIQGVRIYRIPFSDDRNTAIVLVDIPDSAAAPHQTYKDRLYYWRYGGTSERAPHFHLELLRNRPVTVAPTIEVELMSFEPKGGDAHIHFSGKFHCSNRAKLASIPFGGAARLCFSSHGRYQFSTSGAEMNWEYSALFPGQERSHPFEITFVPRGRMDGVASAVYALLDLSMTVSCFSHNHSRVIENYHPVRHWPFSSLWSVARSFDFDQDEIQHFVDAVDSGIRRLGGYIPH